MPSGIILVQTLDYPFHGHLNNWHQSLHQSVMPKETAGGG